MSYSIANYTGDGSTTQFTVPFPFISRDHVSALVNGSAVPFVWLNDSLIALTAAPAAAAKVVIQRSTSRGTRLVDFQDAQILTEEQLDTSSLQSFYLAQEAFDASASVTVVDDAGLSAAIAIAAASAAGTSATGAANSAASAATSASNASASAVAAAAAVATITNKVDKGASNALSTAFRATIDPNVTFDLATNTLAATFNVSPGSNPAVAAGKELNVFRYDVTATLLGVNSVLAGNKSNLTAATSSLGNAYGYYTKVNNLGGGTAYGLFAHGDATGGVGGVVYPLFVRTTGSPSGTIGVLEADGTCAHGIDIQGINSASLSYGFSVQASVQMSVAAFQYVKSNGANASGFLMFDSPVNGGGVIAQIDKDGFATYQYKSTLTGAVQRTNKSKLGDVVSVDDFGAKGDGVTDDTVAIQTAFTNAVAVSFRPGATYKVTDTLFVSHPSFAIAVKRIHGRGATINFTGFARSCTDDLTTTIFGLCSGSPTTAGNFSGWNGAIDDLKLTTANKIVMLGGSGCRMYLRNVECTSVGTLVKGGMLFRNSINMDLMNCTVNMTSVCTDTIGSRSFFTATYNGVNQNIPSSFGCMLFGFPAQLDTLGRAISPTTASVYFNDSFNARQNLFAGGQTGLLDGGSLSHLNRNIMGNEFSFHGYGIITNSGGVIQGNWIENVASACIRTVAGGPPWYGGSSGMPLTVMGNSFAPHNSATALLLDAIPSDSVFMGNIYGDPFPGGTFVNVGASGFGNRAWWINNTNPGGGTITGLSAVSGHTAFTIIGGTADEDHPNGAIFRGPVRATGLHRAVVAKTANYTAVKTDGIIVVDATSGSVVITLPAANANGAGWAVELTVKRKDSSANTVTVQRAGADTLDAGTSTTVPPLNSKSFASDGVSAFYLV
jgi:hypothetical protein